MAPYIGITDFDSREMVDEMWQIFCDRLAHHSPYELHVGIMMSWKTLHDQPSKWAAVWPDKSELANIFSHPKTYNCLHYADYDGKPGLAADLASAISYGGDQLAAVQLDMIWPNPCELRMFRGIFPDIEIILQVGRLAFKQVEDDPKRFIEQLGEYEGAVDRLLLDRSGGEGKALDAGLLLPYLRAVRESLPELQLGVAGGLGPTTMHLLDPLLDEFNGLSIDAQGQLRASGDSKDLIDRSRAAAYLNRAIERLT